MQEKEREKRRKKLSSEEVSYTSSESESKSTPILKHKKQKTKKGKEPGARVSTPKTIINPLAVYPQFSDGQQLATSVSAAAPQSVNVDLGQLTAHVQYVK